MIQLIKARPEKLLLRMVSVAVIVLLMQGCTTTYNNNHNWHRTPPSTGRSKCGCMLIPKSLMPIKVNDACSQA